MQHGLRRRMTMDGDMNSMPCPVGFQGNGNMGVWCTHASPHVVTLLPGCRTWGGDGLYLEKPCQRFASKPIDNRKLYMLSQCPRCWLGGNQRQLREYTQSDTEGHAQNQKSHSTNVMSARAETGDLRPLPAALAAEVLLRSGYLTAPQTPDTPSSSLLSGLLPLYGVQQLIMFFRVARERKDTTASHDSAVSNKLHLNVPTFRKRG